jgi:hypothetical protein
VVPGLFERPLAWIARPPVLADKPSRPPDKKIFEYI